MNHLERLQVVQNAYFVQDLDEAIARWHAAFGLGPFIVSRHLAFERTVYRGSPASLDISAAFVQSGDLQIELLCQHDSGPSMFHDMFGPGEEGLHHIAVFAEDYDRFVNDWQARGFDLAAEVVTREGLGAGFIDTRALCGHLLEVYRDDGALRAFYSMVANAARDWDGHTVKIEVSDFSR
jgi:hypothetical protein